jgi:hypothetical protein
MPARWTSALLIAGSCACSDAGSSSSGPAGSGSDVTETSPLTPAAGASSGGTASAMPAAATPAGPIARADEAAAAEDTPFVVFIDAATGFMTDEVHDVDREIVHFDAALGAMVSPESGDAVSGWSVTGADLRWSRSGVAFRVRFGTEEGERRAYFTEAGPGTICNLSLAGPDVLFISGTNQTPPDP